MTAGDRIVVIGGILVFSAGFYLTFYDFAHRVFIGKASDSTKAIYQVPNTPTEIALERRAIHLFLAEYERDLIVTVGQRELLRQKLADDTGGYSRMDIYQISPTVYFLSGALSFDKYILRIGEDISLANTDLELTRTDALFVGSFDRDNGGWRFIPARELGIQITEQMRISGVN